MKKRFLIWMAALLGAVSLHAQPQVIDCQCLRTQAVLNVTNCMAVVPDLCLFTQCLISTVQPPPPVTCSQSPTAGTPVGPGITMITVTVISSIGVVEQCVIPFTVVAPNNGPFALLCAPNKTVECGTMWTFNQPTPTNYCCPQAGTPGNGVTLISVTTTTNGTCPQIITRTWTARDNCGHLASCSQIVTVVDTTPPVLPCTCLTSGNAAFPPIPLTVTNCSGVIPDFCQIALFCATDNCGPLTCTQSPPAGTIVGPGIHPITVSVRDCAGNIASCQLNFTVVAPATGPFALICAPNKTVECGTTWTFNPPTPTNFCCPPQGTTGNGVTLISVTTTTNGSCPQVFTRTWTMRDGCGVIASCSQIVTVVDTTPPVLNCQCLQNNPLFPLTVTGCSNVVPDFCLLLNACATDSCGPLTCSQSPPAGTIVFPGVHPITVTVTDCAGNKATCTVNFTVVAPPGGCCLTPPAGMVAWWPLDELTGAPLFADATGNGHTAIVESGGPVGSPFSPTAVAGVVAGAKYFYGLSPRGRAVNAPLLNFGTGSFSADCWVNPVPTGVIHWHPIVDKLNQTGPTTGFGYTVGLLNQRVVLKVGDGTIFTYTSVGTVPYSAWSFVAVVVNRTANTVTFHLNGVTEAPQALSPAGNFNSTIDLLIGSTWNSNLALGELAVDELELFNLPLATTVLNNLWSANSSGKCKTNACVVSIFCPTNQFATASCTQACAVVNYPLPLIAYGMLSSCAPPPGFCFPIGVTTVTCVATNVCGQPGQPAVCSFNVTVAAPTNCCVSQTNFWNTGMGGGVALAPSTPDPSYFLVSAPPGGCTGPPQVLLPSSLPVGPWVANGPNSQWIGAGPTANCQPGVYHYRLCFYMPCTNDAAIIGQWAVDDNGAIHLNGQPTGNTIPSQQYPNLPGYGWFPVSITNGFVCGTNCLDFYVTNAIGGINPTGLRAELTNVFNDCCCPPVQRMATVNSGADVNGPLTSPAPDTQFALTCAPAGVTATVPVVINPGWIPSVWVPNSTTSQWIGPDQFNNAPAGVYCYTMTFTLPCPPGTPMKASLTGRWTADDWASIQLNGQPTGHSVPSVQFPLNGFDAWHPINITNGFVAGLNTLTFYVTNAGGPTGLRLEMDINSSCCDCTNILCDITITCPPNVTNYTCGISAVVNYLAPAVSGTCPPITTICAPPSGSAFPLGPTTVTCTATDAQGNSKSCSFVVTVIRHTTPWTVTCPPLQMSITGCPPVLPDLCSLVTITTNCPFPGPLTCTILGPNGQPMSPGTVLPSGTTVVIVRICDGTGICRDCDVIINAVTPPGCYPCCPVGATTGPELVINPAFSAGNTGFTSDYSLLSPTCSPGLYTVATSLTVGAMCNNWACLDHTIGSPTGQFFVCDGSQTLGQAAWRQQVTLSPSTQYSFCAWVNNLNEPILDRADPIVQVWLVPASGPAVMLTSSGALPESPDVWVQISGTWTAPAAVSNPYRLEFRTASTSFEGNNFAIDDISFRACSGGCTTTPVLSLFSGANSSGVLPGGVMDPQFRTGPPLFTSPNPWVPTPIVGSWVPNSAISKWVSPKANMSSAPGGVYVYTNRFFLCSTNQAAITGRWTADNSGSIRLNGAATPNFLPPNIAFQSWYPVSITSGFVPGWNTLTFHVTNNTTSLTGLRTEITGSACCNSCVTIACPVNKTTNICTTGVVVNYPAPAANSACAQLTSVSCTPASGSVFPLGVNTVTCTAVDALGNAATCSFNVTVQSASLPVIIMCPPNQTILVCSNSAKAYYKVKATGQVGPVVCTPPSGSTFAVGTNNVVCFATNACGQGWACSFLIIVKNHLLGAPDATITAGIPDNFVLPAEASPQSACVVTAFGGFPSWKGFDVVACDTLFGHRFTGLPNNIAKAELVVRMKPTSDPDSSNDGLFVGLPVCLPGNFRYVATISTLPGAGGTWNPGKAAVTFTRNLGVLNPLILSDMNTQGYLDVVVHDDTTVDYMQLRIWRCPPPQPGIGVPYDMVGGATAALRPIGGTGIGISPKPAICVFPNPNVLSGISLQPGAAKALTFTTVIDFDAPEGAGLDIVLPPDPRNTNGMPYLSFRSKGAKGYCVKTAKLYDDEPDIAYRSSAIGTNGDLFPSFTWDAANIETNVLLWLNRLPGVTGVVMTVTIDLATREATLEFPDCLWTADHGRKGWDGCIYGNGTPSKGTNKTARLILGPRPPHIPMGGITEMSLLSTGLSEFLVEDPEITAMGRRWGDGHVTLMKAYDDGEKISFVSHGEGGGVHTDLGHAASFSIGIHHFEDGEMPEEEQLFLMRGVNPFPTGLTNRPPPPTIPLRLAKIPGGVACSVDFSDLAAESITVQLWSNGVLIAQGSGPGSAIEPESPLILDRWPDRLTQVSVNGELRLTCGELMTISGIQGDEIRIIPELPQGVELPAYIGSLECLVSEGMDSVLFGLQTTLACPPDAVIHIARSTDGVALTWDCDGYLLQGAEEVTGPWFDLGVESPASMSTSRPWRFFRLRGR